MTTSAKLKQTWQEYAQSMLLRAIFEHRLTHKQLAELLEKKHGMKVAWKTLGRRIGRKNFDAGFFFAVMATLEVTHIDMTNAPKRSAKLSYTPGQNAKSQAWMPQ